MRNLFELERYRLTDRKINSLYGSVGDETSGAFIVPSSTDGGSLRVIASSAEGWDHLSVSRERRCPNWYEMEQIKHLFAKEDEVWVQYHVPVTDHINVHPNVLHIWRPTGVLLPLPPSDFV